MKVKDAIISILSEAPNDQYGLHRRIGSASMSEVTKAIAALQNDKTIHVVTYRKSLRTGLDIPVYSLRTPKAGNMLDIHHLLAGVTSERLVEYVFVAKNLPPKSRQARILDVGSGGLALTRAIQAFSRNWQVLGIDMAPSSSDAQMDGRFMGIMDNVFDQVISVSTIEHIGVESVDDENGDIKTMDEIFRVMKKGASAIITVPYGKCNAHGHRVYNKRSLSRIAGKFSIAKKEFYCYSDSGKWKRCSQTTADSVISEAPRNLHSRVALCLLLRRQ